jgi:hypothetical protein
MSSYDDSDDEPDSFPPTGQSSSSSFTALSNSKPSTSQSSFHSQSSTEKKTNMMSKVESDEESFKSINSNDISSDLDDEFNKSNKAEDENNDDDDDDAESEHAEAKVLDSDDELLKNEDEGPQTNILLKLHDESHKFKYPASRTVRHLINYIYRNYLVQTGIYDNKTKRFSLFSKIHNQCLTTLDQEKDLQQANIHPSIVLLHNTLEKEY